MISEQQAEREPSARLWVKVCGVTTYEDARMVQAAGADAIGLNFAPGSPRCLNHERARAITSPFAEDDNRPTWVGVFVNATLEEIRATQAAVGLDLIQLHGDESAEFRQQLGLPSYHAARIATAEDVSAALALGGTRLLVDAKVKGAYGGTGETFDWTLLDRAVSERELVLAGGLTPENIETAVRAVRPFGVDTASGVESAPGKKDKALVENFVRRARSAV